MLYKRWNLLVFFVNSKHKVLGSTQTLYQQELCSQTAQYVHQLSAARVLHLLNFVYSLF